MNLATTNTKKLTDGVEEALSSGGVEAAKEFCRNTKGPVASIFYQGLDRVNEGVESAEKAVVAYGGVQMGQLEKSSYHYEKALKINPKHLGALEYQGELYIALGDIEKAKENLVRIDDICFTQCTELKQLKRAINSAIN